MSPQYLCVKKPLKMANDQRNVVMLNYATITLSSEWKKIQSKKQNDVISLFILAKVAAKWQLLHVTLLFWNSKGENKLQICDFSRYFSRKGKKFSRNFEPFAYFSKNHLCNYSKTILIIHLRCDEYRWIKALTLSRFLFTEPELNNNIVLV